MKDYPDIDEKLSQPGQKGLAKLVRELPEDEVSMIWRSQLNERIAAMAAKPKKSFLALAWKPATGLVLAASIAGVFLLRSTPRGESPTPVASSFSIVDAHTQVVAANEISVLAGASDESSANFVSHEFDEIDLAPL